MKVSWPAWGARGTGPKAALLVGPPTCGDVCKIYVISIDESMSLSFINFFFSKNLYLTFGVICVGAKMATLSPTFGMKK